MLRAISRHRGIIVVNAMYLGGVPEIRPHLTPVQLLVGDLRVVVEVPGKHPYAASWPSSAVSELGIVATPLLYDCVTRGSFAPIYRGPLRPYEDDGVDIVSAIRLVVESPYAGNRGSM